MRLQRAALHELGWAWMQLGLQPLGHVDTCRQLLGHDPAQLAGIGPIAVASASDHRRFLHFMRQLRISKACAALN